MDPWPPYSSSHQQEDTTPPPAPPQHFGHGPSPATGMAGLNLSPGVGGATGTAWGLGGGEAPRCLNCWVSGTECYFLEGFSSCIPCSASGQNCSSAHTHFLPFTTAPFAQPSVAGAAPPPMTTAGELNLNATMVLPPPPILTGDNIGMYPSLPSNATTGSTSSDPFPAPGYGHGHQQGSSGSSDPSQFPFSASAPHLPGLPAAQGQGRTDEQPPSKKRRTSSARASAGGASGSGRSRSGTNSGSSAGKSSPPRRAAAPALPPPPKASAPPPLPAPVAPQGAEAKVIGAEAIRALASELLEESFRVRPECWGLGTYLVHDMRSEFERVGRVMKRMGPVAEALIAIRVAWGASATMHPAIVPSSVRPDARVLLKGDLSVFGRERSHSLKTLANQAAKLCEDLGALEVPTYRNVALLCELATLFARRDIVRSKSYMRAASQHWRRLNARKRTVHHSPAEANICFGVAFLDAICTFFAGARGHPGLPELSDEEIVLMVGPCGIPGTAWVKPDWYADMDSPSWCDLPVTDIGDVIEASICASYRMLSVVQSACARVDGARVPPATYQKVLDTVLRQKPSLQRARTMWTEPVSENPTVHEANYPQDSVTSCVTVPENQSNRAFIYWIHTITQSKLAESSRLIPVHDQVSKLVWHDISRLAHFASKLRREPPQASSYWGSHAQVVSGWLDLLPNGQAYLAQYVREGPGKLEARRFEAENICSLLKSAAFFGDEYCDRAQLASDALKELDSNAGKTFPDDYRHDPTIVVG